MVLEGVRARLKSRRPTDNHMGKACTVCVMAHATTNGSTRLYFISKTVPAATCQCRALLAFVSSPYYSFRAAQAFSVY